MALFQKKKKKKAAVKPASGPAEKPKPELRPDTVVIVSDVDAPAPRPAGAPAPILCRSEHETPQGWVYILKEAVQLKSGEWTRKLFINKPGHESNLRPCDREWLEAQKKS